MKIHGSPRRSRSFPNHPGKGEWKKSQLIRMLLKIQQIDFFRYGAVKISVLNGSANKLTGKQN